MIQRELLYGTTNPDKLVEVQSLSQAFGIQLEGIVSAAQQRLEEPPIVVEDSSCYEGNAVRKALTYAAWAGMPCLADDTGLEIGELGGYPGVYTARVGVRALRARLVRGRRYEARFVCCVAYAEPSGRRITVTAELAGTFVPDLGGAEPRTSLEFSPYFVPEGEYRSLRDLLAEGYSDSHRAKALRALLRAL
jgi:XTP/dITP diphosphohydrolase